MISVAANIQLVDGERQFGQYQVQIARQTATGWVATVPPLNATVTNCRLILKPQTRKPYPPASIPTTYIVKVSPVTLGQRNGVLIALRVGYELRMFVGWSQVDRFSADLRKMLTPSLRAHFIPSLSQENLVRLIEAINGR
jgi:hypothetical protein